MDLVITMTTDIALDIGSSKTVITSGNRTVLELPSVVTVDSETWEPIYYGLEAQRTVGRTPDSLVSVFPISGGTIAEYETAESMLCLYMKKAFGNRVFRPSVMATLPTGVTEIQHHALASAIEAAGGRNVSIIESPLAAALALGIDFTKPEGNMVVDIGAGTTDIAVLSMGGIASCDSFKTASNDFDDVISKYIKKEYNIIIGPQTAREIKEQIGSVYIRPVEVALTVKGRNIFTGLPENIEITSNEISNAIRDTVDAICNAVRAVTEQTDPDLVGDIHSKGIHLCGGGSQLFGIDKYMSEYLGVSVVRADDPAHTVVKGAAYAQRHKKLLKNVDFRFRSIKELIVE